MFSALILAQEYLTRYGMTTYVIFGNIGLIFNICMFSQSTHRRKSSSLYILAMSLSSLIGLNSAIIPIIYSLDHPNPLSYSDIFCKLQYYFRHGFSQLMRIFLVLACIDRYTSCSNQVRIRSFSHYKIALYIIPTVSLFILSLAIFPTMLHSITNGICDVPSGLLNIMYSIYILIVLGLLPTISLSTFGCLLMINLKKRRMRIHSNDNSRHVLRKRDRDMIRMLLVELIIYIFTTIPNTIVLIYKVILQTIIINEQQKEINSFIYYFARIFLLYLNNSLSFWIYLSTSKTFRKEFLNFISKFWYSIKHHHNHIQPITR